MVDQKHNLEYQSTSGMDEYAETMARMERLIKASLCANCRHQGDCMFLLRASEPIIECELHECGISSRPRLTVVKPQRPEEENDVSAEEAPLGLCGNCDHLKACRLPKSPSGVWHCEEYC